MALISRKKKTDKPTAPEKAAVSAPASSAVSFSTDAKVLIRPRITEKASDRAANANVYVFDVARDATKRQIESAVAHLYKIKPTKIAMVPVPAKKVFVRGKIGHTAKGKKAYVYLKKGDKIEFV